MIGFLAIVQNQDFWAILGTDGQTHGSTDVQSKFHRTSVEAGVQK